MLHLLVVLSMRIADILVRRGLDVVTRAAPHPDEPIDAPGAIPCDSATAHCVADVDSASRTRFVVSGEVSAIGSDRFALRLSLFDSELQRERSRAVAEGATVSQLADAMPPAFDRLFAAGIASGATTTTTTKEPSLVAPIGGGIAGLGVLGLAAAGLWVTQINGALGSTTTREPARQRALDQRPWAWGALTSSAVVTVVGGGVLVLGLLQE